MPTPPDAELVAALGEVIRARLHAAGATAGSAEWSQAGSAHAGRIHPEVGSGARSGGRPDGASDAQPDGSGAAADDGAASERIPLPAEAAALFARLRAEAATAGDGAWLSARIDVPAEGAATFHPEYSRRPWWNSTSDSMLSPTPQDLATRHPEPGDAQWLADLERHPRPAAAWPTWLPAAGHDPQYARLREALDRAGIPRGAVRLPGEDHPYFEGALIVRRIGERVLLELTDYGQVVTLAAGTAAQVCDAVWRHVTSPLPAPLVLGDAEAKARAREGRAAMTALAAQVRLAGPGGIATNLAPGLLFDRIGALDGLYFFGWRTPLPGRSLPVTATGPGAAEIVFLSRAAAPVQAEFAPAWFGQPGGALRFRALDERVGVRDLVRGGALVPVRVTATAPGPVGPGSAAAAWAPRAR